MRRLFLLLIVLLAASSAAFSQTTKAFPSAADISTPPAAQTRHLDVKAAVDAYLALVPAEARARSNTYFEGGYWLILWDFLFGAVVALALLNTTFSAHMRDLAERITRFRFLQTFFYWIEYLLLISLVGLPLTIYEGFFRERQYGLMNQSFGDWFSQQMIGLVVGAILGGLLVTALFGIVRRLPRTWWIWGSAVSVVFLVISILIGPVFISPLFNKYTKLKDERVRQPILALARANGIPATDVWEVDASRQSNRVSANVSGFLGTERITLNDNLLRRCSLEEIAPVMGHEMGHYVLNHIFKDILFFTLEALLFSGFLRWSLEWTLARWGAKWQIRGIGDTAVLPLVMLLASVFGFVMTPVNNSWTRAQEYEADLFGINASRQPDGEAKVDLMLGEYRKLDPSLLEEIIFFDHPSGRTRITAAMRYKAEHMDDLQNAPSAGSAPAAQPAPQPTP